MMGEKVGAVIVPAAGLELDVEAIIAHVRERIADFKVPQYVALRERAAAAQPRRQGAQGAAARRDRMGRSAHVGIQSGGQSVQASATWQTK